MTLDELHCVELARCKHTVIIGYELGRLHDAGARYITDALKEIYPDMLIQLYERQIKGGYVPPVERRQ